jgi:hypothetical protein
MLLQRPPQITPFVETEEVKGEEPSSSPKNIMMIKAKHITQGEEQESIF